MGKINSLIIKWYDTKWSCTLCMPSPLFPHPKRTKKQEIASFTVPVVRLAAAVFHATQAKSFQRIKQKKTRRRDCWSCSCVNYFFNMFNMVLRPPWPGIRGWTFPSMPLDIAFWGLKVSGNFVKICSESFRSCLLAVIGVKVLLHMLLGG